MKPAWFKKIIGVCFIFESPAKHQDLKLFKLMDLFTSLLKTGLSLATPLLLVSLGEIISERSGILNIGVEGIMLTGALAGVAGTLLTGNPWFGLLIALFIGVILSLVYGIFTIKLQSDQVIIGTGLNLFAIGVTGIIRRGLMGAEGKPLTVPSLSTWKIPGGNNIPILGQVLFSQDAVVYVTLLTVPIVWFWLFKTHSGLKLRAVGENPEAADSVGLNVSYLKWKGTLLCGAFCGVAGGYLALGLANTFVEGMTAGRGFIALAIVIVSRWNPWGALLAAFLFGTANALQYRFQASGIQIPYQALLALPYVLTLVVAAVFSRQYGVPKALGKVYERD